MTGLQHVEGESEKESLWGLNLPKLHLQRPFPRINDDTNDKDSAPKIVCFCSLFFSLRLSSFLFFAAFASVR